MVTIGEGAHFVVEYWTVRQRVLRFLNQRCGFDTFALEFGFSEALSLAPWLVGAGAVEDLASVSAAAAD